MAFDFNEARAIIEQAKQKGLIREPGSPDPTPKAGASSKAAEAGDENLPDWLKKGIREPEKKSEG